MDGMALPAALHPEALAFLAQELDESEREEFFAGLRPLAHQAVDLVMSASVNEEALLTLLQDGLAYLESWQLSVQRFREDAWRDRVDALDKVATEPHEPVDSSELRRLLNVR